MSEGYAKPLQVALIEVVQNIQIDIIVNKDFDVSAKVPILQPISNGVRHLRLVSAWSTYSIGPSTCCILLYGFANELPLQTRRHASCHFSWLFTGRSIG